MRGPIVTRRDGAKPVKAWTQGVPFEDSAREQVERIAAMRFIHEHVAVMPDVHAGIGATVGSVIATKGAIIPAAVGVDIGCGMMAARTSLMAHHLPDSLAQVRTAIEARNPHGRTDNGGAGDVGSWTGRALPFSVESSWLSMSKAYDQIVEKHPRIGRGKTWEQLGTLGTGNHFIELCLDENDRVWIMLHSGSRGPGNRIGTYFIERARRLMESFGINLPDKDLAFFPENHADFSEYLTAVGWAQCFAETNREVMMNHTINAIANHLGEFTADSVVINCHHNYVARERHYGESVLVTRKGAVRAERGDLGIIPGSMGARSFIVRGLGNRESFNSCSHGAGRVMSRTAAKASITIEEHAAATAGIECRKDADVLDESPRAYKNVDDVMAAQSDLVEIVHTLRQVVCVKG